MINCPKCNGGMPDNASFCAYCGLPLRGIDPRDSELKELQLRNEKSKGMIYWILGAVFVFLGGTLAFGLEAGVVLAGILIIIAAILDNSRKAKLRKKK